MRSAVVRRDLAWAAAGVIVAIVATSLVSGLRLAGDWATPLAYPVAWIPLVGAVALACRQPAIRSWWRTATAKLGPWFDVFDVF